MGAKEATIRIRPQQRSGKLYDLVIYNNPPQNMLPTGISGTELLQFSAQHSREGVTANTRDSTSAKGQHAKLASFLDVRISGQALKDRSHRAVYSPAARSLLDQKKQELRQSYRRRV